MFFVNQCMYATSNNTSHIHIGGNPFPPNWISTHILELSDLTYVLLRLAKFLFKNFLVKKESKKSMAHNSNRSRFFLDHDWLITRGQKIHLFLIDLVKTEILWAKSSVVRFLAPQSLHSFRSCPNKGFGGLFGLWSRLERVKSLSDTSAKKTPSMSGS